MFVSVRLAPKRCQRRPGGGANGRHHPVWAATPDPLVVPESLPCLLLAQATIFMRVTLIFALLLAFAGTISHAQDSAATCEIPAPLKWCKVRTLCSGPSFMDGKVRVVFTVVRVFIYSHCKIVLMI